MATRLIINADDFGFSVGVTDGILRSHKEGVLTSTTLMTTMPDRDRAIDLAGQTPSLGVGIHISLTQGTPLTDCRRLLTRGGGGGEFRRSLPRLFWSLRSDDARKEAEAEIFAQINYAQSRKLMPTHVDSHKHVCHLPALHGPLIVACKAAGISWVRTAREVRFAGTPRMGVGYRMLARYAKLLAERVAAAGLRTPDWFYGLATTGRTCLPSYQAIAQQPPVGLGELMVHPGYSHDVSIGVTRLLQERLVEMEALIDPQVRYALERAGVERVRFAE